MPRPSQPTMTFLRVGKGSRAAESGARLDPADGQPVQRVRPGGGRGQGESARPDGRFGQGITLLGSLDQLIQPELHGGVVTLLHPPAEHLEPEAHQRVLNARLPGIAGDAESDLTRLQVLDHLEADSALLQMTLEGLVAAAPDALR